MQKVYMLKYGGNMIKKFFNYSKMDRGILYIAFGIHYINEALISAESVKKHNKNLNITLMCNDSSIQSQHIDNFIMIDAKHIRAKIDYIHKTPYKETIFLDSDTIIDHNVAEMFDILHKYDFAIAHDYARKRENIAKIIPEYDEIPYIFSEVNPGVMVFKNNFKVRKFFSIWRKFFYKYKTQIAWEQPSFRVALWKSDMNLYIFPPEYNIRSIANRNKQDLNHEVYGINHLKPRIYHMHANENIAKGEFNITTVEECLEICKNKTVKI